MALSYQEIIDYSNRVKDLTEQACDELTRRVAGIGAEEPERRVRFIQMHVRAVAEEYGMKAQELGAQWYELCAKRAGVNVQPAIVGEIDYGALDSHFNAVLRDYENGEETWEDAEGHIRSAFEDEMRGYSRRPVIENLDRDERGYRRRYRQTARAARRAGYARVPVGETCAWCYMLASLGYYYRSEQTALGVDPDHYHAHCDCIAVPYYAPDEIDGYGDDYEMYFDMYATARDSYRDGDYSDDMARRIEDARIRHEAAYDRGETTQQWTDYNAILMIMRDQQGLSH